MSAGATFERVFLALKDQIGSTRYAAGEHLEPAALSLELNASVTPVRDALHRLVGEGLVESLIGEGFRMPLVSELGLRHLYRWNNTLVGLAARSRPMADPPATIDEIAEGYVGSIESLFLAIAGWSGNPEHSAAISRVNERLRAVRRTEENVLQGIPGELSELVALGTKGPSGALRRRLAAFHRRRERQVDRIVAALLGPSC